MLVRIPAPITGPKRLPTPPKIEEQLLLRVERATRCGEKAGNRDRHELVAGEIHANASSGLGFILDRAEVMTEKTSLDCPRRKNRSDQQAESDVVVRQLGSIEHEGLQALLLHRKGQAHRATDRRPVGEHDLKNLRDRDRGNRKIVAFEPETRPTDTWPAYPPRMFHATPSCALIMTRIKKF